MQPLRNALRWMPALLLAACASAPPSQPLPLAVQCPQFPAPPADLMQMPAGLCLLSKSEVPTRYQQTWAQKCSPAQPATPSASSN